MSPGKPSAPLNSARKLGVTVVAFVLIVVCVLALDDFRTRTLGAIRAYVQGEGLWSKAQKEAVINLRRYVRTRNDVYYQFYLTDIAVPLGDRQARLELEKNEPNLQVVYQGFLQGRNHPNDVGPMATLFRRFRHLSYLSDAIDTWADADRYIAQMQQTAEQLRAAVASGGANDGLTQALLADLEGVDAQLTPLEDHFSAQLSEGARTTSRLFSLFVSGSAALLLGVGIALSLVLSGQIQGSENELAGATESLRKSEGRFRSLVQHLFDVITVLAADGTVRYVSPSAERVFGYPPEDMLRRSAHGFIHAEDLPRFQSALLEATAHPGGTFAVECRFRRADGSWAWLEGTGTNLLADPAVEGIVITCRDVTERRSLEDNLRQAQKMEAVGRLAGGIAHDFNNLLAIIGGYAEIIMDGLHPDDPRRRNTRPIVEAVDRAAALTQRLLTFSRKHEVAPRTLDLNAVLAEMSGMLTRLLGAEIETQILPSDEPAWVKADLLSLEQVLINLAINSRDAMANGGKLTIETRLVDLHEGQAQREPAIAPGSYVLLSVSDTGCGMAEEVKSHAFEPFFTTKEPGKGTGLGLSIVYGIIQRSGGHVAVESEPGAGTTMAIYLPRVAGPVEDAPSEDETHKAANGSGTILVVEDEELVREVVCKSLAAQGYTVLEAAGAATALDVVDRQVSPIDILITDLILPKVRGPELARQVRERYPELKVLYMSGFAGAALVRDGGLEPDAVVLQKPFKLAQLAQAIREVHAHA
jgi:PAS domain S-box-containing protein